MIELRMHMDMPKTCSMCPFCYDDRWCKAMEWKRLSDDVCEKRESWCPLRERKRVVPAVGINGFPVCGSCKNVVVAGANFCHTCGRRIGW